MAHRIERLNRRWRWTIIAVLSALGVGVIALALHGRSDTGAQVPTATAQVQTLEETVSLVGTIAAGDKIEVVAPFDATIRSVPVKLGQTVVAGQPLVIFDTVDLQQHAREAEAAELKAAQSYRAVLNWTGGLEAARADRSRSAAEATMDDDRRKLRETEQLFKDGIIPRSELDNMKQQLRTDQATLMSAADEWRALAEQASPANRRVAELDYRNAVERAVAARRQLAQAQLTAPRSGVLIRPPQKDPNRSIELAAGGSVTRGQTIFAIADRGRLSVVAKIDESDANKIREGQRIEVTGPGFQMPLQGHIVAISGETSPENQGGAASFAVIGELDSVAQDVRQLIRLGMTANIRIVTTSRPNALVVPASAIQGGIPDTTVTTIDANGQSHVRKVQLGMATEQGVEILKGVAAGETVKLADEPQPHLPSILN